ncbi:MAG TPA: ubiquinol-cytochrome c reductase iron-sulfur subunit [Acidimicrobiia bacterium]|nr:ubiquinol-cytochrome c reductase iron-sulfur subunit [Acidimicrobiia bacterium]
MSATQILVLAFAAVAVLALAAIFAIAFRRGDGEARPERGRLDRRTRRRDHQAREKRVAGRLGEEAPEAEPAAEPVPVDPLQAREEVDEETMGVTRRQFFNRGVAGVFGLFLAQFGLAALAFMWPKLRAGGFGSKVIAGRVDDLATQVFLSDGRVSPVFVPAAQSYIVPFQGELEGSSFEGLPVVAGGLMALWQRCVHLGCRVPQCESSQGFECPCHGSKYNYHGEYEDGPAPRNLDHFAVEVDDAGNLVVDTGTVLQTARASVKTTEYPQGPSCI